MKSWVLENPALPGTSKFLISLNVRFLMDKSNSRDNTYFCCYCNNQMTVCMHYLGTGFWGIKHLPTLGANERGYIALCYCCFKKLP